MRSTTPKVLHELCGRPMVAWPVLRRARGRRRARRRGRRARRGRWRDTLPEGVGDRRPAGGRRHRRRGPRAPRSTSARRRRCVVLSGDVPLVTADGDRASSSPRTSAAAPQATMATMMLDDPTGYGRVVRDADGSVERVVETKADGDATPEELAIRRGQHRHLRLRRRPAARRAAERLTHRQRPGRAVPARRARPRCRRASPRTSLDDPTLLLGVNDRADLAAVRAHRPARASTSDHMRAGVTIVDPATTLIDADVRDRPGHDDRARRRSCAATTAVGEGCTIGPLTTAIDAVVGDDASVVHSYLLGAEVGAGRPSGRSPTCAPAPSCAPARRRARSSRSRTPTSARAPRCPHLSYIGDADVGPGTNLGAATITANYDGARQAPHDDRRRRAHVSVDTTLRRAGHGRRRRLHGGRTRSITEDVPAGALGIARARQTQHRGLRGPQGEPTGDRPDRGVHSPLPHERSGAARHGDQPADRLRQAADAVRGPREPGARAPKIADKLGVDLGPVTLKTFSNGEVYCRYEESIRGADVFIVQPTCGNPDHGHHAPTTR